jgi:hypothetical protein
MKVLRFSSFADNLQNLFLEELSGLSIHACEVKIKILAACLNPSDVKNVQGRLTTAVTRDPCSNVITLCSPLPRGEAFPLGGNHASAAETLRPRRSEPQARSFPHWSTEIHSKSALDLLPTPDARFTLHSD